MKFTQTGLPAQVREVDRRRRRPGARRAAAPAHRRGTGRPGRRSRRTALAPAEPEGPPLAIRRRRRRRRREDRRHGSGSAVAAGTGSGAKDEDPAEDERGSRDPGQQAGDDRHTRRHGGAEGTSTSERGRIRRTGGRIRAPMSGPARRFAPRIRPRAPRRAGRDAAGRRPAHVHLSGRCRAGHRAAAERPATAVPTPSPRLTLPPLSTASPTRAAQRDAVDRVATRIRIAALDIDMPVIARHRRATRYCDVAMYLDTALGQPGQGRATLPLRARPDGHVPAPARDARRRRSSGWSSRSGRATTCATCTRSSRSGATSGPGRRPERATREELWLQTSEGPRGHARQDPGHRPAAVGRERPIPTTPTRRPSRVRPATAQRVGSDPVDPAQDERGGPGGRQRSSR